MFSQLPAITRTLLIANLIGFGLQWLMPGVVEAWFALWPLHVNFQPWQLLSYGFLHGGLLHIAFNMFGLTMFGADLERLWGPRRFLMFYLISVLTAGLTQLVFSAYTGDPTPTVGASGGVYGLVLGFAMMFPERRIMLLFPPIPMPARVFALLFAGLELYLGATGTQSGVAHFAHLGGMLGGFIVLQVWKTQRRLR